jgi:type IV pilus assembly protein PilA
VFKSGAVFAAYPGFFIPFVGKGPGREWDIAGSGEKGSAMGNRFRSQKGFTLVELLIVMAIIGVIAAIAIPVYLDHRGRAYNAAAQSDLRNFRSAMEAAFAEQKQYPPM